MVIPPPIRGLGQTGGFQMMVEDRRSLGLAEFQRATTNWSRRKFPTQPAGPCHDFQRQQPAALSEHQPDQGGIPASSAGNVFDTLQAYLGSSFVNLFNKFNQVFQVYIQADSRYRLQPEDIRISMSATSRGGWCPWALCSTSSESRAPS